MRPRGGNGSVELVRGRDGSPRYWRVHYNAYVDDKRIHKANNLGSLEEYPTIEDARLAAAGMMSSLRIGPRLHFSLRHKGQRSNAQKAICSRETFAVMVAKQNGRCATCGDVPEQLCVDHDHKTRMIRGLLCAKCNSGIGLLGDSPDILRAAADYLERHKAVASEAGFEPATCRLGGDRSIHLSYSDVNPPVVVTTHSHKGGRK